VQNVEGRQLVQLRFLDDQRQTSIAAGYWMANPISFIAIEKKHLVCFRYNLILSDVAHKHATVWKYELCRRRALFRAH